VLGGAGCGRGIDWEVEYIEGTVMLPMNAYRKALRAGKRLPHVEADVLKDPQAALRYARHIVKGRWPEAEPLFAGSPLWAYAYAKRVLNRRWRMGERAIQTSPVICIVYITDVVQSIWSQGERAILQDPLCAAIYAAKWLKRPWRKAESLINTDPEAAAFYASVVLKKRWRRAEGVIAKDETAATRYADAVLQFPIDRTTACLCPLWLYRQAKSSPGGELPPALHRQMTVFGIIDAGSKWVKQYYDELPNATNPHLARVRRA
jgi:hypothetical protein